MIVFKKIKWKNFLSTGNQFLTIDLNKSASTLVIGENGSGKSTLLDALCFVLFNRPFRLIKKEQVVNSINEKDCVVNVDFTIGTKDFKIKRGIKPNFFEIYCNDILLNQDASNIDYQKHLENNILKLIIVFEGPSVGLFDQKSTNMITFEPTYLRDRKLVSLMALHTRAGWGIQDFS